MTPKISPFQDATIWFKASAFEVILPRDAEILAPLAATVLARSTAERTGARLKRMLFEDENQCEAGSG